MRTSVSVTISPSSISLSRNTPCVLGCCGPMLMSIISVRNISILSAELHVIPVVPPGRIFLPQRVPLPFIGEQDAAQVRMTLEGDAQEIEGLPFVPVSRAPDVYDARGRLLIGKLDFQVDSVAQRNRK